MGSQPLSLFESRIIGTMKSEDGETFSITIGLNQEIVNQLKERSLDTTDEDLQKNTSDYQRFGTGSYEEWYAKDRTPFALVNQKGSLAALAWFGPKPLGRKSLRHLSDVELKKENEQEKGVWHTIVYRSYAPYRGKKLMVPFMRFAIGEYKKQYPEAKLWAGVSTDNVGSLALAQRLGFKVDPASVDHASHWCALIEE